jgi:Helix-turn-helix
LDADPPAQGVNIASRRTFSQQYVNGLANARRNPTIVTMYELVKVLGVSHIDLVQPPAPAKDASRLSAEFVVADF